MHGTIAGSVLMEVLRPQSIVFGDMFDHKNVNLFYVSVHSENVSVSIDRPDTTNTTTPLEFVSLHF